MLRVSQHRPDGPACAAAFFKQNKEKLPGGLDQELKALADGSHTPMEGSGGIVKSEPVGSAAKASSSDKASTSGLLRRLSTKAKSERASSSAPPQKIA